jgi:hypothetical protein
MNIGNPLQRIPRYAKIAGAGFQNKPLPVQIPERISDVDAFIYDRSKWATNHKLVAGAGAVGGFAANQMLGNPIGGVADALSFGVTNFRPDSEVGAEPSSQVLIMQQPGMQPPSTTESGIPTQPMSLPGLNEEDRKRQLQYLQRKMATDLITMQGLQPGGSGDAGY